MNVKELSRDQLFKLKVDHICNVVNANTQTCWDEIANADGIVSDQEIYGFYDGVSFSEEDF